jgi:hypothetical protein
VVEENIRQAISVEIGYVDIPARRPLPRIISEPSQAIADCLVPVTVGGVVEEEVGDAVAVQIRGQDGPVRRPVAVCDIVEAGAIAEVLGPLACCGVIEKSVRNVIGVEIDELRRSVQEDSLFGRTVDDYGVRTKPLAPSLRDW